jgi:large conductance mechanosensitive channel
MLKEFREFALRGNLLDTAIGLVLGLAFVAVVTALVNGIVMPLIAAIVGEPSFDDIVWTIGSDPGTPILIGTFITALINFLLIAWVLFMVVKAANRFRKPVEEAGPTEVELLAQIRDELARR